MSIYRQSRHPLVRWWWEMDRMAVAVIVVIMLCGAVAVTTASVAVAKTYNVGPYYFAVRHYLFLMMALGVMLGMTTLKPEGVKRIGMLLFAGAYLGVLMTFMIGTEVKGARRWIDIGGQSIQPTEFLKPALILVTAWLLAHADPRKQLRGYFASILLMMAVGLPVLAQPNFGMALAMGLVWFAQVFMAGLPLLWLAPVVAGGLCTVVGAYTLLPHVRDRLERFINPEASDTYQVDQANEAIMMGHLWGRGAGEGVVKHQLPDAHTDFIFAVLAEEFGIIVGIMVMGLFLTLVLRGFSRVLQQDDRFVLLSVGGLLTLVSIHVCVNIGVALHIVPTTGMTLPFISYGGSSTFAMALVLGFLLALLRKQGKRI
ncbi:MAG: cell division protein FtsW [Alphaproteobacteria bacterium]|nr:MAG: cell division protein FtsW [Alphaproteobacteria bacterium]